MKDECCNQPNNYLKTLGIIAFFFVALFIFSKFGPNIPVSLLTQQKGEPLVVTEEGKETVVPDIALVSFGIEGNGASLKEVQNSVDSKSKDLVAALKKLGVEEKDIKTSSYNVYPNYDYQVTPNRITGYRISINYQVKVRNLDKINDIVVAATSSGANQVGSIYFDLSDEAKNKALETARLDAVTKAKAKAQGLAKAAGITLGKIINISENEGNSITPVPMYSLKDASGGGTTPIQRPDIQPGTTEVIVDITISWEIR
jgi:uncharacterized protein YggE